MANEYLDKAGLEYLWGKIGTKIASMASGVLHYGECATAAGTQTKAVSIEGITELTKGLCIAVRFANAQTYNGVPRLNLNSLGAVDIIRTAATNAARYEWVAGEVLFMIYSGSKWILVDGGVATTTYYGHTKLATSATSTSTALAATPASINSLAQNMIAGMAVYSASSTYAVGDRVRYSYSIWECNTAITTAEAWNAEHWTELPSLQEQIDSIDDLPTVTASDNGKFLRVVDGAWAATSLPSAMGVSF